MVRSIRRNIIRTMAEKKGVKPSGYLHTVWNKLQIKKWGLAGRIRNLVHSTKRKSAWKSRYARFTT